MCNNEVKSFSISSLFALNNQEDGYNIVLLGEGGNGKSTLINSLAYYLYLPNFDDALNFGVKCLIPTSFYVETSDGTDKQISVNKYGNENQNVVNSSTKDSKIYSFRTLDNKTFRFIDTPGIGENNNNLDDILNFISKIKKLHCICLVLKPDVNVINPYFKTCLLQLFTRLEKSASRKIIFVFTHTRCTHYEATDTKVLLGRIIKELQAEIQIDIPLDRSNLFCFDNEGFKFLVTRNNGVRYGNRKNIEKSWKISVKSTNKLLTYLNDHSEDKKMCRKLSQETSVLFISKKDFTLMTQSNSKSLSMEGDEDVKGNTSKSKTKVRRNSEGISVRSDRHRDYEYYNDDNLENKRGYRDDLRKYFVNDLSIDTSSLITISDPELDKNHQLIIELIQPLIDMLIFGFNHLQRFRQIKNELMKETCLEKLLIKFIIPEIDFELIKLKKPATVCTNSKCIDMKVEDDIHNIIFKTKCHNPCLMKRINRNAPGPNDIRNCSIMKNKECLKCGCNYKMHGHIYYQIKFHSGTKNCRLKFNSKDFNVIQEKLLIILQEHSAPYYKGILAIFKAMAKFGLYLRKKPHCPKRDFYEEYMTNMITRYQMGGIDNLLLSKYYFIRKTHEIYMEQLQNQETNIPPETITSTVDTLFKLPIYGNKIHELHQAVHLAAKAEYINIL